MAVLAERFPGLVPVRHSAARARSAAAAPTPLPGSLPPHTRATLTGVPEGPSTFPAPAAPSAAGLGAWRSTPTGTLAPPRRWLRLAALAAALLIASAFASFALVSLVRRPAVSPLPRVAPSRDAPAPAAGGASDIATPVERPRGAGGDAAGARAPAAPPIDAGAADTPKPDAIAVQSAHPTPEHPTGSLRVVGVPILTVTVDGKHYGDTPLTIPLNAGKHRVRLQNVEHHSDEVVAVTIVDHQTLTIDRMPK